MYALHGILRTSCENLRWGLRYEPLFTASWLGLAKSISDTSSTAPIDDRAVGHVEVGPTVAADVEVQEVHHATVDHAVPQVAGGAAENERQSDGRGAHGVAVLPQQYRHDDRGRSARNPTSAAIFQGNAESANRPKAAPRFSTWLMWKRPGMTVTLSCKGMYRATAHLVRRSSTMTDTAIRKKYFRMDGWMLASLSS